MFFVNDRRKKGRHELHRHARAPKASSLKNHERFAPTDRRRTDAQKGIEVKRLLGVDCGGDQEGSQQSQPASKGQKIERERKKGPDPMALKGFWLDNRLKRTILIPPC